jgi:hypothetical protein
MATSGTYAFTLDAGQIITEAWERCQMLPEALKGWQLRSARVSLNLMFLEWATRGINLWAVEKVGPTALTAGVATIATGAGTIDLLEATVTRSGQELMLTPMGRDDYVGIPNKATTGRPAQYWVEKILPAPVIHLYPTPENSTDTFTYYRLRQLQDISTYAQNADAPALFLEAICSGLAARIALKWVKDPNLRGELRQLAVSCFKEAFAQDTERVGLSLTPDFSGWRF